MAAAKHRTWFRIGWGAAALAALLPAIVALLHLVPPALAREPAAHHQIAHHQNPAATPAHHHGGHHQDAPTPPIIVGEVDDDCPPANGPQDQRQHHGRPHCPLCLWLKTFHVVPPPEIAGLWQPSARPHVFTVHESLAPVVAVRITAQPRAPPISPAI